MSAEKLAAMARGAMEDVKNEMSCYESIQTRIINVSYYAGVFGATMELLFDEDMEEYFRIAEETKEIREEMLKFTNRIWQL